MSSDPSGPKRPPRPTSARPGPTTRAEASAAAPTRPTPWPTVTATIDAPPAGPSTGAMGATKTDVSVPAPVGAPGPTATVPAPRPAASAAATRRRRGRRVTRVVRRIDLWSVLKLSLIVYSCLYAAVLATLAVLWSVAYSSGSIEKLQSFLDDVGLDNFTFYGNQMFRACAAIGGVGVLAGTVITVLATALVNVISEISGGIRLVVIEEDVDRP